MKRVWMLMMVALLAGCGEVEIDENMPIEQVAAEAAKMGQAELQSMVDKYEGMIAEKAAELEALTAQLKELSISELMGEKAKVIKAESSAISDSLKQLKEQLEVYAKALSSISAE